LRRLALAPSIACLAIFAATSCGLGGSGSVARYTDLVRFVPEGEAGPGKKLRVQVWDVEGDRRTTLVQKPGSRVILGPLPLSSGCELRTGLALAPAAWPRSTGVRFRASVFSDGSPERNFLEDEVRAAEGAERRWRDRAVAIPRAEAGELSLALETEAMAEAPTPYDVAGWGAPHVVCRERYTGGRPALDRPPIVLVSIDTLRADHLGVYGYRRATSPTLDQLAAGSLVFERAFAPAPWTLPSHASLFTGLYPEEHGAGRADPHDPLPAGIPTLAEILRGAGYRTLAFTAGGVMSRRSGLDRGFEVWREHTRASLRSTLPAVFDELGTQPERPFFLFLHTYDVHGPYEQPPGARVFRADAGDPRIPLPEWERILRMAHHRYQRFERFRGLDEVVAAYDSGIRFVDDALAELFARLREIGVWEDALVVVTSDHGESLYERALYVSHTYTLHDEVVRVPLLVRLPNARRVGRSAELVDLVDLLPLVLEEAGVAAPAEISGSNPLPRADGTAPAKALVRGEASHTGARYVRSARWKLTSGTGPRADAMGIPASLRDRFEGGAEWFDLEADPGERQNLVWRSEAEAGELSQLRATLEAVPRVAARAGAPALDDEEAARLRELGYVE
jgi:arylsulfatase A-like enzyme